MSQFGLCCTWLWTQLSVQTKSALRKFKSMKPMQIVAKLLLLSFLDFAWEEALVPNFFALHFVVWTMEIGWVSNQLSKSAQNPDSQLSIILCYYRLNPQVPPPTLQGLSSGLQWSTPGPLAGWSLLGLQNVKSRLGLVGRYLKYKAFMSFRKSKEHESGWYEVRVCVVCTELGLDWE